MPHGNLGVACRNANLFHAWLIPVCWPPGFVFNGEPPPKQTAQGDFAFQPTPKAAEERIVSTGAKVKLADNAKAAKAARAQGRKKEGQALSLSTSALERRLVPDLAIHSSQVAKWWQGAIPTGFEASQGNQGFVFLRVALPGWFAGKPPCEHHGFVGFPT